MGSGLAMVVAWPQSMVRPHGTQAYPEDLRLEYGHMVGKVRDFVTRQYDLRYEVVAPSVLKQEVSRIQLDAATSQFAAAKKDIGSLNQKLANWNLELNGGTGAIGQTTNIFQLPILLYHNPPPDFEQQLIHLEESGYTVINLDQALVGMGGGPLPPKPVVITFDDGYVSQMAAFEILKRHNLKATFYIIDAGSESLWCIGAGRHYGDPMQPTGGCGDEYFSWDQIRKLDQSGLITIAGHTVNHRNLATLSPAEQRMEIAVGKEIIEKELGHSIRHFAYPYGAYNADSLALVREAGYLTAVTTLEGSEQAVGYPFELRRVRDALMLP